MKKYLSIFLISIYLFSNSEARQFLKIPKLIEHFIIHKENDEKTTFISFIKNHYLEDHGKDADYQEDMKLPFKTHDSHCHAVVNSMITPPKTLEINLEKHIVLSEEKSNFIYKEPISSDYNSSVFRPPIFS